MTTDRLISSSRVAGTAVYNPKGERLGHIDDVMIDKPSGRIAYAVLAFGGFLGFNDKHHPLPWSVLHYDLKLDGYVVDLDRNTLLGAPSYASETAPGWDAAGWTKVDDYYGAPPPDQDLPIAAAALPVR
jgi:sporulation protein YlmC with PRC-barrel domain